MIETALPFSRTRTWVVTQHSQRWLPAVRRFAPDLMPEPLLPVYSEVAREQIVRVAGGREPSVVVVEADPAGVPKLCETLVQISRRCPAALVIVAVTSLIPQQHLAVIQFPLAVTVRHPEQLAGLGAMIRGHFARFPQTLD